MNIYAISDLHLPLSIDKPMDIFGDNWKNYVSKLEENWRAVVKENDLVLMPGDLSWATYIKDTEADFDFINNLPGKKIITKGNHDYWWETLTKLNTFLEEKQYTTIHILHNTVYFCDKIAVCGTKGYVNIEEQEQPAEEDLKLYNRELGRLELSLQSAKKMNPDTIIVMLHYPPGENSAFMNKMKEYNVDICVYGHLHGKSHNKALEGDFGGLKLKLVSCDYLNFMPFKLM